MGSGGLGPGGLGIRANAGVISRNSARDHQKHRGLGHRRRPGRYSLSFKRTTLPHSELLVVRTRHVKAEAAQERRTKREEGPPPLTGGRRPGTGPPLPPGQTPPDAALPSTFPGGTSSSSCSSRPISRYRCSRVQRAMCGTAGRSSGGAEKPRGTWGEEKDWI